MLEIYLCCTFIILIYGLSALDLFKQEVEVYDPKKIAEENKQRKAAYDYLKAEESIDRPYDPLADSLNQFRNKPKE